MNKFKIWNTLTLLLSAIILSGCSEIKTLPPLDRNVVAEDCAVLVIPANATVKRIDGKKRGWLFSTWYVGYFGKLFGLFGGSKAAILRVPAGEHTITYEYLLPQEGRSADNLTCTTTMNAGEIYKLSIAYDEKTETGTIVSIINTAISMVRRVITEVPFTELLPRPNPIGVVSRIDEVDHILSDNNLPEGKNNIVTSLLGVLVGILWCYIIRISSIVWYFVFMGKLMNRHTVATLILSVGLAMASVVILDYNSNRIFSLYLLLTLLIGISLSWWDNGGKYNKNGVDKFMDKNYNEAISDFEKAILTAPYNANYINNRGMAYTYLQQWKKAIVDFDKAIKMKPNTEYINNRGIAYCGLQEWKKVVDDFDMAERLELNSEFVTSFLRSLNKGVLLKSDNVDRIIGRGLAYYNLQNWEKAITELTKAVRLKPDDDKLKEYLANAQAQVAKAADEQIDAYGDADVHMISYDGNLEEMKRLKRERNIDINARNSVGDMPINIAAGCGHIELVDWLLENGADVNARGKDNATPVYRAAINGQVEMIKHLKEKYNADLYLRTDADASPLDGAVANNQMKSINSLKALDNNIIKARNKNGETAIFLAASIGNDDVIRCLADLNGKVYTSVVNATDYNGCTPMFIAALSGKKENINCLAKLGADVNARNEDGMTPIFMAAGGGYVEIMKCLKRLGAKLNVKDKNGNTPIDVALRIGHHEAAEWLRANKEKKWLFVIIFIVFSVIAVVLVLYILPQLNIGSKQNQSYSEEEMESDYFIDSRDGQKYRAVKIGNNTWMAQNLNYRPQPGRSGCYDKDMSYCTKYGRLYDWNTAMTVCPSEWHLPTRHEWAGLVASVGGDIAGIALKTRTGWIDYGNGTDDYDFSALPGGSRAIDGTFKNVGNRGLWWTATEYDNDSAYYRRIGYNYDYTYEGNYDKNSGFSVRCVQDGD